jgi:hypothetical protein
LSGGKNETPLQIWCSRRRNKTMINSNEAGDERYDVREARMKKNRTKLLKNRSFGHGDESWSGSPVHALVSEDRIVENRCKNRTRIKIKSRKNRVLPEPSARVAHIGASTNSNTGKISTMKLLTSGNRQDSSSGRKI